MDNVGRKQLYEQGGDNIAKQDDALGNRGANQIESSGEDDDIEDIVDQTYDQSMLLSRE